MPSLDFVQARLRDAILDGTLAFGHGILSGSHDLLFEALHLRVSVCVHRARRRKLTLSRGQPRLSRRRLAAAGHSFPAPVAAPSRPALRDWSAGAQKSE